MDINNEINQDGAQFLYNTSEDYCPICGNPIVYESGLAVCYYCGWSEEE